jgi:integrase
MTGILRFARRFLPVLPSAAVSAVPSAAQILEEMLAELDDLRRSSRHIGALRSDLGKFVALYPRLELVTDAEIVSYLRGLSSTIGPRRRDNIRDSLVQLFRFAKRRDYLPEGRRTAAEKIRKIKPGHEVVTWSPPEARILLEHISPCWLPCEVIGLFAGLRKSEILRLDWSAFKWDLRDTDGNLAPVIAVTRKVARKVRTDRLVPISENLIAWLQPYRDRVGPLYPGHFKSIENAHSVEMVRMRRATGLTRKDNANRHSFGSYRLAIVKSYDQVALEMGNSPRKVRESYNDPQPETLALEYFTLMPPSRENVVPMNLELSFEAAVAERQKTPEPDSEEWRVLKQWLVDGLRPAAGKKRVGSNNHERVRSLKMVTKR